MWEEACWLCGKTLQVSDGDGGREFDASNSNINECSKVVPVKVSMGSLPEMVFRVFEDSVPEPTLY